ncbi:hypothetical protein FM112_10185 [Gulosibacter sp. 10]|nr:hypothetical protein FM112_10185 [Gulosibacter sp. 10]
MRGRDEASRRPCRTPSRGGPMGLPELSRDSAFIHAVVMT